VKRPPINIRFQRFGWLWALRPWGKDKYDNWLWLFWCLRCMRLCVIVGSSVKRGIRMCDHCGNRASRKHGHATNGEHSPSYASWVSMRNRCERPSDRSYRFYGAKGIKVCERWNKFENFLTDMGVRPEGTTLGRLNDEGDYEPGNAFWQTAEEQAETQNRKAARAGKKA